MKLYQSPIVLLLLSTLFLGGCVSATTVGQEREVKPRIYQQPINTVYDASLEALHALEWTVVSEDRKNHRIEVKAPMSLWTWGDDLIVLNTELSSGDVRVDVESETGFQVYDWGKNKQNIIDLYQAIDTALATN